MRSRTYLGAAAAIALAAMTLLAARPAAAIDVTGIQILTATEREDGTATNTFFDVIVAGTDLNSVGFRDLTTNVYYDLTFSAGRWNYHDAGYSSVANLYAVHPNPGNLLFYFNAGEADNDLVLISNFGTFPADYFDVTSPLDGSTVPDNTLVEWTFGGTANNGGVALVNLGTSTVEDVMYSPGAAALSWAPTMTASTDYGLVLGVWNVMTGAPVYEATLYGDYFTFIGILNNSNYVAFSTDPSGGEVPEPATLALLGMGLAGLGWLKRRKA